MFTGNFDAWAAKLADLGSVFPFLSATGRVDTWTGASAADIGPIYPFVGWEWLLLIIGMAFWIFWHIWQTRHESAAYRAETEKYASGDKIEKAIRGERVS